MSGNINYFIDGRWGSQLASRRVLELTDFIRERKSKMSRNLLLEATIVVDECLDTLLFRQHLRGFVFLRQILIAIYLDGGLMTPLSKTVFPEVATIFNCSVSHVERNVRYLFDKLGEDESYIRSILDTNAELPDYVYQESENREKRLLFKQDTAYSIRTCLSRLSSLMKTHALTYHEGKKENDELDQNELKVADDNEEWEK
ncbi:MAG: sporulation initiation factor Spo0A C-terminal domain-containing protein [Eubacteriales bacterium]|nr:sporulation initiation factor Spo0A C-terminal domain-containing protein [Eubacteriales bacterium]